MEEEQIKRKKVGKHSAGKEKIKKQKGKKGRISRSGPHRSWCPPPQRTARA